MTFTIVIATVWTLGVTVFWMAVGWRAMRAHETIAEGVRQYHLNRKAPPGEPR